MHKHAVLDGGLFFDATDGRLLLLDCVAVQLVEMAPPGAFALCERGSSYALYNDNKSLQLVDLAMVRHKRVFSPRACLSAVLCCIMLIDIVPAPQL